MSPLLFDLRFDLEVGDLDFVFLLFHGILLTHTVTFFSGAAKRAFADEVWVLTEN